MNIKKYTINEKFFDRWSSKMAYILGWIYSDGNIAKNRPRLKIACCDEGILFSIREMLGSNHPIYSYLPKNRTRTQYTLVIDSHKIYNKLLNIGLVPAKSKIIHMPKIPNKYFAQFVRGIIDGDGSVFLERQYYKNKKYIFLRLTIISASEAFLNVLQNRIHKLFKVRQKNLSKNRTAFQIKYSTKEALPILKKIYQNSNQQRLERKYQVYNTFSSTMYATIDK